MLLRGLWAMVPRQRTIEVDAVHDQPVVGGERLEPHAGVDVVEPLGDVDVHADAQVAGQVGGRFERVVLAGERGVHADHAAPAGAKESLVLGQAAQRCVVPVAIGDAVRAARPARPPRRTPAAMTSRLPSIAFGLSW